MPRHALRQALRIAAQHNEQTRPHALQALAPALPRELLDEGLAIARSSVRESGCTAWGIACLLPLANERRRTALAQEANEYLDESFWDRPRVLGLLAPYVDRALKEVQGYVCNGEERGLSALVHFLPNATARQSEELIGLAVRTYDKGQMLELSEFLPEPVFRNALDHVVADAPGALYGYDARLASVSRRLVKLADIPRAFTFALNISDRFLRTRATQQMADSLRQLSRRELLALWNTDALLSRGRSRHDAFGFVAALSPLVYALGGQKAILELDETIKETVRWWY